MMTHSEILPDTIALVKFFSTIIAYSDLVKGNNSSVYDSILTKFIRYQLFIVPRS